MFLTVLIMAAGAAVVAGILASNRRAALWIAGAILSAAILVGVVASLLGHGSTILAVAAASGLAVGLVLQKVNPAAAVRGAAVSFMIMLLSAWVALHCQDPAAGRSENMFSGLARRASSCHQWLGRAAQEPGVMLAVGLALLATSRFLSGWHRIGVVFAGVLLLGVYASPILAETGAYLRSLLRPSGNPTMDLATLCVILITAVGLLRLLMSKNR